MYPLFMSHRYAQRGLSLVELMIALVIGLIMIAGVFHIYAGSTQSRMLNDGIRTMQENARFAISALQTAIRPAGFARGGAIDPFVDTPERPTNGAQITVRFESTQDCAGNSTAPTGVAVNGYFVDAATQELRCLGNDVNAPPQPIVDGVEQMRILYGLDDDGDGLTNRYVRKTTLNDLGANLNNDVTSVRVALLLNTIIPVTDGASNTHRLLDTQVVTDDRLGHQVYTTTVLVRNRMN